MDKYLAILELIESYPEDALSYYRAFWAILPPRMAQILKIVSEQYSITFQDIAKNISTSKGSISSSLLSMRKIRLIKFIEIDDVGYYSLDPQHKLLIEVIKEYPLIIIKEKRRRKPKAQKQPAIMPETPTKPYKVGSKVY